MASVRCRAQSKTTGEQCGQPAIRGGAVCRYHGGGAPQVKEAARIRLLMAADLAAGELVRQMMGKGKKLTDADRRAAAIAILDRAGLKPTEKVELTGPQGGPIELDLTIYTTEELELFDLMTKKAAERAQLNEQKLLEAGPDPEDTKPAE